MLRCASDRKDGELVMVDPQLRHHASTYLRGRISPHLAKVLAKASVVELQVAPSSSVKALVPSMGRRNRNPSWKVHQRTCSVASVLVSSFAAAEPLLGTVSDVVDRDGRPTVCHRRHLLRQKDGMM